MTFCRPPPRTLITLDHRLKIHAKSLKKMYAIDFQKEKENVML
jgi:hypothetical protein